MKNLNIKINPKKKIFLVLILILFSGTTYAIDQKAGIGFGFGIKIMQHSKSTFGEGSANYFRLIFKNDEKSMFYMHNEFANFNVEEGKAQSTGVQNSQTIGSLLALSDSLYLDVMIGGTTIDIPASVAIAGSSEAIAVTTGTGILSELGVLWIKNTSNVKLETGISI